MTPTWTTAADLRAQVRRRWDKGELLTEMAAPGDPFPLRLSLRGRHMPTPPSPSPALKWPDYADSEVA